MPGVGTGTWLRRVGALTASSSPSFYCAAGSGIAGLAAAVGAGLSTAAFSCDCPKVDHSPTLCIKRIAVARCGRSAISLWRQCAGYSRRRYSAAWCGGEMAPDAAYLHSALTLMSMTAPARSRCRIVHDVEVGEIAVHMPIVPVPYMHTNHFLPSGENLNWLSAPPLTRRRSPCISPIPPSSPT